MSESCGRVIERVLSFRQLCLWLSCYLTELSDLEVTDRGSFFSTALPLVFDRVVLWLTPLVDSLEVTDLISDDCLNREYAQNVYNWTSRSRDTRSKASDTRAIFFSRRQRNGWNFIALPARAKWLHAQWFFGRVATITWKKNNIISIFMSDLAYIF